MGVLLDLIIYHFSQLSFPYVCGGVAADGTLNKTVIAFSLRMWGCCPIRQLPILRILVFPTYVGVLPIFLIELSYFLRFPYVCGGVAITIELINFLHWFSLRMWGCCPRRLKSWGTQNVFPTYVGVLPTLTVPN